MTHPYPPSPQGDGDPGVLSVAERVTAILVDEFDVPLGRVRLEATIEELGLDSLDRMQLTWAVEDAFDVDLPDRIGRELRTVEDLVRFLETRSASDYITS